MQEHQVYSTVTPRISSASGDLLINSIYKSCSWFQNGKDNKKHSKRYERHTHTYAEGKCLQRQCYRKKIKIISETIWKAYNSLQGRVVKKTSSVQPCKLHEFRDLTRGWQNAVKDHPIHDQNTVIPGKDFSILIMVLSN